MRICDPLQTNIFVSHYFVLRLRITVIQLQTRLWQAYFGTIQISGWLGEIQFVLNVNQQMLARLEFTLRIY